MKLPAKQLVVETLGAREVSRTQSDLRNAVNVHGFRFECAFRDLRIQSMPAPAGFLIALMRIIRLDNSVRGLFSIFQIRAIARPGSSIPVRWLADMNEKACVLRSGQGLDSFVTVKATPGTHSENENRLETNRCRESPVNMKREKDLSERRASGLDSWGGIQFGSSDHHPHLERKENRGGDWLAEGLECDGDPDLIGRRRFGFVELIL
jgi:hypothetical protein